MGNVLGIDQSYTSSGYCIKKDGVLVEFGIFKSSKELDVYDRAVQVANFISAKLSDHAISQVNIEGLAFGIRGDATRDLAGLLFTVITTIRRVNPGVPVSIIAPTSLKKFATGSGKSDKAAMMSAVPVEILDQFTEAKYKKTTGLADLCDAYWLATFNENHHNG